MLILNEFFLHHLKLLFDVFFHYQNLCNFFFGFRISIDRQNRFVLSFASIHPSCTSLGFDFYFIERIVILEVRSDIPILLETFIHTFLLLVICLSLVPRNYFNIDNLALLFLLLVLLAWLKPSISHCVLHTWLPKVIFKIILVVLMRSIDCLRVSIWNEVLLVRVVVRIVLSKEVSLRSVVWVHSKTAVVQLRVLTWLESLIEIILLIRRLVSSPSLVTRTPSYLVRDINVDRLHIERRLCIARVCISLSFKCIVKSRIRGCCLLQL